MARRSFGNRARRLAVCLLDVSDRIRATRLGQRAAGIGPGRTERCGICSPGHPGTARTRPIRNGDKT
jgi:hypothetical protein